MTELPPDVICATKVPTEHGEVAIMKSTFDYMCTRISLGGTEEIGYYCNYRGRIEDVKQILKIVLEALDDPKLPSELT